MKRREGRCWCCGRFDAHLTEEHILAVSIGGTLATPRFCDACNGIGGRVEQLLAKYPDLQERIGLYAIPDRHGVPQLPHREVTYEDGTRGHMQFTPGGPRGADTFPRILERPEDGPAIYEVPEDQMESFQAARNAKGKTVRIISRRRGSYAGGTTRYGLGERTVPLWGRFAAKVALGVVSLIDIDEAWLDTQGAEILRALFLHGKQPPYPVGVFPAVLDDTHPLTAMLQAPEHLLWLQPRHEGGSTLGIVLFADLLFSLPIANLTCPPDHPAWHVSPGQLAPRRESFSAVTGRLHERREARDPDGRWSELQRRRQPPADYDHHPVDVHCNDTPVMAASSLFSPGPRTSHERKGHS
jgi:hypothetical protein